MDLLQYDLNLALISEVTLFVSPSITDIVSEPMFDVYIEFEIGLTTISVGLLPTLIFPTIELFFVFKTDTVSEPVLDTYNRFVFGLYPKEFGEFPNFIVGALIACEKSE